MPSALPPEFRDCLYFPCRLDKSPATPNGFKDATPYLDPSWLTVGLVLQGPLFVVDVDIKAKSRGDLTLERLESENGNLADPLLAVRTPSGGYHFYYLVPEGVKVPLSNGAIGPGLDIRGNMNDGYIIAPGSYVEYVTKDGTFVKGYYECL